jgi:integrase
MASITKRGNYQFQAQVRRRGYPTQQKTFETWREANEWATVVEAEMHRGTFIDRSEAERITLGELLERYGKEVTPDKKGFKAELNRIKRLQKHSLAFRILATLRATDFSAYRDERLKDISGRSVQIELALLSHVLNIAKKDWSIPVENHIKNIRKPKINPPRERRLVGDEERRLLAAADSGQSNNLAFCIRLALETGMRAGEIVGLERGRVDLKKSVVRLEETKNGSRRSVPLTKRAEELIRKHPRRFDKQRLVDYVDSSTLSNAFHKCCERAEIEGLRFHDLRHEAASRKAPYMPAATLAKVMGWKVLQMTMRYYNPTDEDLVAAVRNCG